MAMTRGSFSNLVAPGVRKVIFDQYDELTLIGPKLFNQNTSKRKYEDDVQVQGFSTFSEKTEGGTVTYEDTGDGWTKRYTHTTYALGFRVTEETQEDELYGVVNKLSRALGRSQRASVETLAANIFNNAFSTAAADLGPDAKSLCNTGHVLKGTASTSTNRPSTDADLTVASYEAGYIAFRQMLDEKGLKIEVLPKFLVCSLSDEATALKVVGSSQQAFTADNQINPYLNKVSVLAWPYLTDTDAWFLVAAPGSQELNWFWRIRPAMSNSDDFDTGDAKFKMRYRCSVGFSDWRGIYGTAGA